MSPEDKISDEKRVVLVKPGDILLVGNVGPITEETLEGAAKAFRKLGFRRTAFFQEDINIGALSAEDLARLAASTEATANPEPWAVQDEDDVCVDSNGDVWPEHTDDFECRRCGCVYGDQSWVAHGAYIKDGSFPDGKIFHRSVTVTYGEWRSVDEPERKAKPMTTYRLPDVLGGAEFELDSVSFGMAWGSAAGIVGLFAVPFDVLIKVEPPLPSAPPEPPDGSVVRVDNRGPCRVFERDGRSEGAWGEGRHWWVAGREDPVTWTDVCSYGTPNRLVPASHD